MAWGKGWSWRAKILLALGLGIGGFLGLGLLWFGLRLPPLQWEPSTRATQMESPDGSFFVEGSGATFVRADGNTLVFRAATPTPLLIVSSQTTTTASVVLQNVHPDARPGAVGPVRTEGLTRFYEFEIEAGIGLLIQPHFDEDKKEFRFASIGDTGGGEALDYALRRAADLGADFLLHLGDIEYSDGELELAAKAMNAARIPTYTCIGNHDFHDGLDLVHRRFTALIGPRNSFFDLGGVRFLNLDTAADTWPSSGGDRGDLMKLLLASEFPKEKELVVFTHRPLHDPRPGIEDHGHAIGHAGEVEWLRECFLELGVDAMLHGHIHQTIVNEVSGMAAFIIGNGLNYPEEGEATEAGILIGEWHSDRPQVSYKIEPLYPAE
jgi:Icc-related predicted phosphoesterase